MNTFKPIDICFTWNRDLAIKASKLFYDWDMKHSSKRYIGWLFIALTQFAIVGALKHHAFGLLFIATFLVLYWYYIRWYIRKGMIVKYYDKSGLDEKEVSFTLREDGLYYDNRLIGWSEIQSVVPFDEGIVLQTLNQTLFFEKRAFKNREEQERFLEVMREKEKLKEV
jgi:uncharacterized membrane protein YobD (UPF0266 family)